MKAVIQIARSGVLLSGKAMNALAISHAGLMESGEESLEREFHERLAECSTLAYRVALAIVRDAAEAEDVAQEAMLQAYRNFHSLRERGRFRSWLVRIAWRMAIDHRRARRRRAGYEQVAAAEDARVTAREATAEEAAAAREFEGRLQRELDELPEKLRKVMVMAGIEGYNTREVGALLDLPEATVKSRMRLARARLAERLR